MLAKFETKSNRVKGLSFHPKRPWILASLHNGAVHLWDYQLGALIDKFEEHEGPVRGVSFHSSQPLFVSGGDDYKIKVWNYKSRKCLFTLHGHMDYVRTVYFHHDLPWIISASDDQTIRIWNWQSRSCLAIITGHNHYVMSAMFHPKEDLIISASLDQSVRVWEFGGLKKKHSTAGGNSFDAGMMDPRLQSMNAQLNQDPFANTDVMVKFVLEGHERGVNWAAFHPTAPLIVSGGDDRVVKIWRMNGMLITFLKCKEYKAWAVDTCRGHYNNVSCALFHPKADLILSNSEDKTIRIWDLNKRNTIQTFRRENDRFWMLVAHPENSLFAAGHDNGFVVFKLERERPAMAIHQNRLFYVKDKVIKVFDMDSGIDSPLLTFRRGTLGQVPPPKYLSYNPSENTLLMTSDHEGGIYETYPLPSDISGGPYEATFDLRRGPGKNALYIARNKFAVFEKGANVVKIKDSNNSQIKEFTPPDDSQELLWAGPRLFYFATPSAVVLYDAETKSVVHELQMSGARYCSWSKDGNLIALISRHMVFLATKNLDQLAFVHETMKIKGGVWDDMGVFLYSTLNHVKFVLPNGDNGTIKTLDEPLYPVQSLGNKLISLNRRSEIVTISFDPTEYLFKLALSMKDYDRVLQIIRNSNLVGQSIISYLEKKGYPEVALQFVKDVKTRFELALECGNLEVALESAKTIDKDAVWIKLGEEAINQGNHMILEMVYQRTKNFDALSMLYLMTGNIQKLKKMLKIADVRGDIMSHYHNAMLLGDVEDQIHSLKGVGQLSLAYLAAKTHGLDDEAASILEAAGLEEPPQLLPDSQLLKVPTPINQLPDENWPLLPVSKNIFESGPGAVTVQLNSKDIPKNNIIVPDVNGVDWGDDLEFKSDNISTNAQSVAAVSYEIDDEDDEGWGLDDDLDIPATSPVSNGNNTASPTMGGFVNIPSNGVSLTDHWVRTSGLAVDHCAAGSFESAMQLLNRQVGISNFAPLKEYFLMIWMACRATVPTIQSVSSLHVPIQRVSEKNDALPLVPFNFAALESKRREAYEFTTKGKFLDALSSFRGLLYLILFTVAESPAQANEIKEMVETCREYILGMRLNLARKDMASPESLKKGLEMAIYFTHCNMESVHLSLALHSAMKTMHKAKNFATAYLLAGRLLELNPPPQIAQTAKKIQIHCEKASVDEVPMDYDPHNPFVTCGGSLSPIYRGSPSISCPFCGTLYLPEYKSSICMSCEIGRVGISGTGLRNTN